MKNKKSTLVASIILVLVLIASFAIGCQPASTTPPPSNGQPTSEVKTLTVGELLCYTGFFTVREVPDSDQAQICLDIINERGGITVQGQKYRLEITRADGKSTMDGVTAAANSLYYDKKVNFVIGPTAFFAAAAAPVFDPNKVLRALTCVVNTPGELDSTTPYAFLGAQIGTNLQIASIKATKQEFPDVKKVVICSADDGSIDFQKPTLVPNLKAAGIEIIDYVLYPNEMQDFSSIALKLDSYKDADAYYHCNGIGPHLGSIIKGLRELNNYKPYISGPPTSLTEIAAISGADAAKNTLACAISPDAELAPVAREIVDKSVAKFGPDVPLYLSAADCLWNLMQVIQAADSLDTTKVKEKWESLDTIDTIFGKGYVGGDATYGIKHHAISHSQAYMVMKDGKAVYGGTVEVGRVP
jgi:ABC-type branched-subunit amino acid transport system substrate-binding protein